MRKKLHWNVNLPRHGPNTRKKMETLKDAADPFDDIEVRLFGSFQKYFLIHDSIFPTVQVM